MNHHGTSSRTPLHGAVGHEHVEIVRMLIAAGGDPTLPDIKGETPLDLARTRSPESLKLLEQAAATMRAR